MTSRPERTSWWRAPLAVGLLVFFYLAGAAVLVVLAIVVVANLRSDRVSPVGIVVCLGIGAAIVIGWIPSRHRFDPPRPAIGVDPASEPELLAFVRRVADAMDAPVPDEVYLTYDANASVASDCRLLGLRVRRRRLTLGLGLLSTITVDELRALVAHELGHHTNGDTRLGHVVHRGQQAIVDTVRAMPRTALALPYVGFLHLYLGCAGAVSRNQEFAADAWSVRLAGRDATERMLRTVEPTAFALEVFLQRAVRPFWSVGLHPPNLYAGLRTSLAAGGPWTTAATPRATPRSPYDSHPPTADRVARVLASPTAAVADATDAPARSLLRDADATEARLTAALCDLVAGRPTDGVTWDDGAQLAYTEQIRADIQALMALTGAADGPAAVDHVLALDGDALTALVWETASRTSCSIDEGRRRLAAYTTTTIAAGLVKRQGYRWTMRFDGPLGVVDAAGMSVDIHGLVVSTIGGDVAAATTLARLRAA